MTIDDAYDDAYDDDDHPDFAEDALADDDQNTVPCRNCGEEVFEDAVQCCYCGEYGPADGSHGQSYPRRPMWFWLLGLLGTLAVIVTLLACGCRV